MNLIAAPSDTEPGGRLVGLSSFPEDTAMTMFRKTLIATLAAATLVTGAFATSASAKPWHHHHHGHFGAYAGIGLGVGLLGALIANAAAPARDDCYTARRNVYVPGVGIVNKRVLVCE
jgi:hypothetical protein